MCSLAHHELALLFLIVIGIEIEHAPEVWEKGQNIERNSLS